MAVRAQRTALVVEPSPPAGVPVWKALGVLGVGLALVGLGRSIGLERAPRVEEAFLVFASIVIEAVPFVFAGALVSALIGAFVPERVFAGIGRLPIPAQIAGALACAPAFPVCECGSVPVGRRLIARGVHPAAGLTFMFAAPIVNPIVLASTWVAYSGTGLSAEMTLGRAATGFCAALVGGLSLQRFVGIRATPAPAGHQHGQRGARLGIVAEHFASDALFMARFLVIGAALAAALQTGLPANVTSAFASIPVVGALTMMVLAVVLSLCSESDAFVAASFVQFSHGAQLAFLALGPLLDLKLAALYAATFKRAFTPALILVIVPLLLVAAAIFDAFVQ
jgi:uncharacterized membrane protein YraQ (UPF0718 family)